MASAVADDASIYRFGAYELNLRSRQLLRLGRPVAIQPRPFDLLVYLMRHRDRPVSREELLEHVWRGVHVDDEALRFTLHTARRAVGDDGTRQEVIRTIPRVGYRLVAPIVEVTPPADANARATRGDRALAESPFVGRSALIEAAGTLLNVVASGEGRVLLLSGEAGIGKSRALDEIASIAHAQGIGVLRGRCVESEGAPAFWPWIQILRAAVGSNPPDNLLRALGTSAREVAWMVPELRAYVSDLPETPSADARAARFLMFDGVTAFLRALTVDRAFLVSIDDLHRADSASAALLQHVARELGDSRAPRMLLVGTHREAELKATPSLADTFASVTALAHARHEQIQGLAPADVATLVRAHSGREPSAAAVADLHRKTNGNPFFLNQILRVLKRESRLAELDSARRIDLELPRHVQDAIRRHLLVLSGPARALMAVASVIGSDFSIRELELAAELERESVFSSLGFALDAGVIGEHRGENGRYRFTHALVRDVLYAGLPIDLRARLHARVAHALESFAPVHPCAESASIAHHYAQSSQREDLEKAVHYYEQAAHWSSARGAFEDAPEHLDRALRLLEGSDLAALTRRCRLLLELGDALSDAGARERAREVLLSAAALARHAGLNEELAIAALRFAPDLLAIESGVYEPDLVRLIEEAIECLDEQSTALRAKLLARLAIALQWNNQHPTRGKSICAEAVILASQIEDDDARDYVDTASVLVNYSLVQPERQLIRVSQGNERLEILQRLLRITSLMLMARIAEADAEISQFIEVVNRARHPQAQWYADLMRSTRAQMEGRFKEAEIYAHRYLALGSRFGDRNAIQSFVTQTIMAGFDTGRHEIEESKVRSMVTMFPTMGGWRAGLTLYLTEIGRLDEARVELGRAIASGALETSRPTEWYATYAALALSCEELGESEIARRLYQELEPYGDQLIVVGYSSYCAGSCHRLLAVLASAMGQTEVAIHHFKAAIAVNNASKAPACNGRVLFEYARMLSRLGEVALATDCATQARAIALAFGMSRLGRILEPYLYPERNQKA